MKEKLEKELKNVVEKFNKLKELKEQYVVKTKECNDEMLRLQGIYGFIVKQTEELNKDEKTTDIQENFKKAKELQDAQEVGNKKAS